MRVDTARDATRGRLRLPTTGTATATVPAGRSTVHVDGRPVGLWYVPRTGAQRLVILLHGAGGTAEDGLRLLSGQADEHRLMLFAPQSVGPTWDMIGGGYGPDVVRIQGALSAILGVHRVAVPTLAVGGFSDGASYALSLGLTNGDVFDAVLAFSPGFAAPAGQADNPAFFVSHGRSDRVLPIDRCSRRIVPALRKAGYPVHYHEFDGGHVVPEPVIAEALHWLSTVPAGR
jgi:predicted esterase